MVYSKTQKTLGFPGHCERQSQRRKYDETGNEKDAIVLCEPLRPFRIVYVNEQWCDVCGFKAKDVIGSTLALIQGPETDLELCQLTTEKATGDSQCRNLFLKKPAILTEQSEPIV